MNIATVYESVKEVFNELDAIYEDYLISLVGYEGLYKLRENELIESCGVVGGHKLYALCNKDK